MGAWGLPCVGCAVLALHVLALPSVDVPFSGPAALDGDDPERRGVSTLNHWYTSPEYGGLGWPPYYAPLYTTSGWPGQLNHNPSFKRGTTTNCNNNDVVLREDLDGLPCIVLTQWAVDIADVEADDAANPTNKLHFEVEVLNTFGSFRGMFQFTPCIDIADPRGDPGPCPNNNKCGATGTGNLHLAIRPHHFGQAVVRVTLVDDGQCSNVGDPTNVCTPTRCCESETLEFQVTVTPVNDCPTFRFRGVEVDEKGTVVKWLDTAPRAPGTGGEIITHEDVEFCQPVLRQVGYGGWNEGPGELGPQGEPWHDQNLRWTVSNDKNTLFKTQPFVRYVEGENTATLCFVPAPDMRGEVTVTIHLEDTGGQVADTIGGTPVPCATPGTAGCYIRNPDEAIRVVIKEVNDPPTFHNGPPRVVVLEDSGLYKHVWATNMRPGPPDEVANGQQLSHFELRLLNESHKALFRQQPKMDLDGMLTFESLPNVHTKGIEVLVEVKLMDAPQPRLGLTPAYSPQPYPVFRIIIEPVNDPPYYRIRSPHLLEVLEDSPRLVYEHWIDPATMCEGWDDKRQQCIKNEGANWTVGGFVHAGEQQHLTFHATPEKPSLFLEKPLVHPNGTLWLRPAADANGMSEITVSQRDNGGTSPGWDTGPVEMFYVRVLPVNDPPTLELHDRRIEVSEDSPLQTIAGFLYNIEKGPPNEGNQTLEIDIAVLGRELFAKAPTFTFDAAQRSAALSFEAMQDKFGTSIVTLSVRDDGGIDNDGSDRSQIYEINIEIWPVNDPPAVELGDDVLINEDTYLTGYSHHNWVRKMTAGPFEDGVQYLEFNVSCDKEEMFAEPVVISPHGALFFTPQRNAFGTARCAVVVGDVDAATKLRLSSLRPIPIRVSFQPVNDAPFFLGGKPITVSECSVAAGCPHTFHKWAANMTAGPNEAYQELSFEVTTHLHHLRTVFTEWPAIHATTGDLTFTLRSGGFIDPEATLTVTLVDDGGTDRGGVDRFSRETTIRVVPLPSTAPEGVVVPVRLAVVQQPNVLSGTITPAVFQLQDGLHMPAPYTATWSFHLVQHQTGEVVHRAVRTSQDHTVDFVEIAQAGAGKYYIKVNATMPDGSALAAATGEYVVESEVGSVLATPMLAEGVPAIGGAITEIAVRSGKAFVDLAIAGGGEWVSPAVYSITASTRNGGAIPTMVDLLGSGRARLSVTPTPEFDITENTTLIIKVPSGAAGPGTPPTTFTYTLAAAPTVTAILMVDGVEREKRVLSEKEMRESRIDVLFFVYGDRWQPDKIARAVLAASVPGPPHGQSLAARWGQQAAVSLQEDHVKLSIGPDTAYDISEGSSDTLTFRIEELGAALGRPPEWSNGTTPIILVEAIGDVAPRGTPADAAKYGTAAVGLAWTALVLAVVSAVVSGSLGPPSAAASAIVMLSFPSGHQPAIEVRRSTEGLLRPFGAESVTGNAVGLGLIAGGVVLLHTMLQKGVMLHLQKDSFQEPQTKRARGLSLFPSASMSLLAFSSPLITHNAILDVAWNGCTLRHPAGDSPSVLLDVLSVLALAAPIVAVGAGVVHVLRRLHNLAWYNEQGKGFLGEMGSWASVPGEYGTSMYHAVVAPYRGRNSLRLMGVVDVGCMVLIPVMATVPDPLGGDTTGCRAAALVVFMVCSARLAAIVSRWPHRLSCVAALDTIATAFTALGCVGALLWSVEGTGVDDVHVSSAWKSRPHDDPTQRSHWASEMMVVCFLVALAALVVLLFIKVVAGVRAAVVRFRAKRPQQHKEALPPSPLSHKGPSESLGWGTPSPTHPANPINGVFASSDVQPTAVDSAVTLKVDSRGSLMTSMRSEDLSTSPSVHP